MGHLARALGTGAYSGLGSGFSAQLALVDLVSDDSWFCCILSFGILGLQDMDQEKRKGLC